MRVYLYLFLSLLLWSCQLDPEDENTRIEKIPVLEVQVPDAMTSGIEQNISFKYALVNDCYSFYDVDFVVITNSNYPNKNIREITAFAEIDTDRLCAMVYSKESYSLPFKPMESKTYLLRFWTGQDNQGNDQFEEFELVVE